MKFLNHSYHYCESGEQKDDCSDKYDKCSFWANNGQCEKNPNYMLQNCCKSCKSIKLNNFFSHIFCKKKYYSN
jgi:hypothetical protein